MTYPRDFVKIDLTPEEWREIWEYTKVFLPPSWVEKHDDGSFGHEIIDKDGHSSNFKGMLGECVLGKLEGKTVHQTLDERPIKESDPGWDIIIGGLKYDIKLLKSIKRPTPEFRYNIRKKLIDQKKGNDGYIWISMIRWPQRSELPWNWLVVGWMLKEEFLEKADFHRKGDLSVTGNKFVYKNATYDIAVRKLHPYKDVPR